MSDTHDPVWGTIYKPFLSATKRGKDRPVSTRSGDMAQAHALLVSQVRHAKADLEHALQSGERNWTEVRAKLERYIDYQTAADVVSGQTKMESV